MRLLSLALWLNYSAASFSWKQFLVSSVQKTTGRSIIYSITGINYFCTCTCVTPDRCLSILIWKTFSYEDFTPTLSHSSAVLSSWNLSWISNQNLLCISPLLLALFGQRKSYKSCLLWDQWRFWKEKKIQNYLEKDMREMKFSRRKWRLEVTLCSNKKQHEDWKGSVEVALYQLCRNTYKWLQRMVRW